MTKWGAYIRSVEIEGFLYAIDKCHNKNTVYEVGCEGGYWLFKSKGFGFSNIYGDDININSLNILKNRDNTINTILKTTNDDKIFINDSSVDLLITVQCPFVTNELWFYKEANRILKERGILFLSVTNKNSYKGLLYNLFTKRKTSYKFSAKEYQSILKENKFEILYQKGYSWMPFKRDSNSNFIKYFNYLEKIFRLNKLTSVSPWVLFVLRKK